MDDITAMDIYDVHKQPRTCVTIKGDTELTTLGSVPTRKKKELALTQEEGGASDTLKGAASWISNGIRLEELKYAGTIFSERPNDIF